MKDGTQPMAGAPSRPGPSGVERSGANADEPDLAALVAVAQASEAKNASGNIPGRPQYDGPTVEVTRRLSERARRGRNAVLILAGSVMLVSGLAIALVRRSERAVPASSRQTSTIPQERLTPPVPPTRSGADPASAAGEVPVPASTPSAVSHPGPSTRPAPPRTRAPASSGTNARAPRAPHETPDTEL